MTTQTAPRDSVAKNHPSLIKEAFRIRNNTNRKNKTIKEHFHNCNIMIFNNLDPVQITGYLKTIEAANCLAEFANLVSFYTVKCSLKTHKVALRPTVVALGDLTKPFVAKTLVDEFSVLCEILTDEEVVAEIKSSYGPDEITMFTSALDKLLAMLNDINQYPVFRITSAFTDHGEYIIKITMSCNYISEPNHSCTDSLERCAGQLRSAGYITAL